MFILSMSLISKAFAPDSIFGRDRIADTDAKKGPPSRRAESAAAVYAVGRAIFLTPVNLDSFFAARAPSISVVPSEGPLR